MIEATHIPTARGYSLGFQRLACRIRLFASRDTLLAAAWEPPDLFKEYVETEAKLGHTFRPDVSLAEIWDAYLAGTRPGGPLTFSPQL